MQDAGGQNFAFIFFVAKVTWAGHSKRRLGQVLCFFFVLSSDIDPHGRCDMARATAKRAHTKRAR
jgi:hypothetical protein